MKSTTTNLTPEDLSKLQSLHADMQTVHIINYQECNAPSQTLRKLTDELMRDLQVLGEEHKRALKELEDRQNLEMDALRKKGKSERDELEKTIQKSNHHFKTVSEQLFKEAKPLLEKMTLADIITLIPEEVRPTLIETADRPGKKMFILQHKLAPECGFLIWADAGHDTKWSIHLKNLLTGTQRYLVCFCGNGCMDSETRTWLVGSLAKTCAEHGITTLFGRRVGEDKDGVQFREGGNFRSIAEMHPSPLMKRANHFLSLHG